MVGSPFAESRVKEEEKRITKLRRIKLKKVIFLSILRHFSDHSDEFVSGSVNE
jgi:hypothetical protein